MVIEADVQIMKAIKVLISNDDDVDGFLEELNYLMEGLRKRLKSSVCADCHDKVEIVNEFPTLYKIWLEVKQQL